MIYRQSVWEIPPCFEPVPARAQAYLIAAFALAQIEEYCQGWPETDAGLARMVRRFTGKRLRFMPRWMKVGSLCRSRGEIYITEGLPPHLARYHILHELIEAMFNYEGVPACVCSVDVHSVACMAVANFA